MDPIVVRSDPTLDEYREATRLRIGYRNNAVRLLCSLSGFVFMVAAWLTTVPPWGAINVGALIMSISAIAAAVFCFVDYAATERAIYKAQRSIALRYTFGTEGISANDESAAVQLAWSAIAWARETKTTYVLALQAMNVIIISKRCVPMDRAADFVALLAQKTAFTYLARQKRAVLS